MANTFLLKIITPSHDSYNGEIEKLFLKNADGDLEILANHEDMITSTVPSIIRFKDSKGKMNEIFVSTAIVNVNKTTVTICSDAAEFPENIDTQRAERAKERAEDRLKDIRNYDKQRVELALIKAKERLKLKK